jgi:truncated hemoglobin YjbI
LNKEAIPASGSGIRCFAINRTIRDRWMRLMENALGEASLPSKAEEVLRKCFSEMYTFMINQSESGIS